MIWSTSFPSLSEINALSRNTKSLKTEISIHVLTRQHSMLHIVPLLVINTKWYEQRIIVENNAALRGLRLCHNKQRSHIKPITLMETHFPVPSLEKKATSNIHRTKQSFKILNASEKQSVPKQKTHSNLVTAKQK